MTPTLVLELVLRGVAIGALAASAAGLWRNASTLAMRLVTLGFFAATISYVLNSSQVIRDAMGPLIEPFHILALAGGGWLWVFIVTLFEDRRLSLWLFAPVAALTLVGFAGWAAFGPIKPAIWIGHNLIEMGLGVHALSVILTSWRGDMVEERRRMRAPFLTMVVILTFVFSIIEIGESFGVERPWYSLLAAAALAAFCLAGCVMFLQAREGLFGAPSFHPASANADGVADAAFHIERGKLDAVMAAGAWRDEGLTVAGLADKVGMPEHRLRKLINDQLGHRNFAAYLNGHRVEAAKALLADPGKARTTVAAIAFDLGFGSLGPFNRAFKEATGMTPTEWRRQAQLNLSPNPEKPG
jgi:AraC-like DNA-binding protein